MSQDGGITTIAREWQKEHTKDETEYSQNRIKRLLVAKVEPL